MDEMLLSYAAEQGAQVFQETRVESIEFSNAPGSSRPISAQWTNKAAGTYGKIKFDWLIDASGRTGILSTKYLKNRNMRESLRNVAVWAYWRGMPRFMEGTIRANSGWFEALNGKS
jgi:flavine halogenase